MNQALRDPLKFAILIGAFLSAIGCATSSSHHYAEPTSAWTSRYGQLLYRTPKTTLIGEVLVRFSTQGDFELTFSKGPGLTVLSLRQDATFAEVKGALAGPGWSGPIDRAPSPLQPWLKLRDQLIQAQGKASVRYATETQTFLFRF